jgi:hypothetical protein
MTDEGKLILVHSPIADERFLNVDDTITCDVNTVFYPAVSQDKSDVVSMVNSQRSSAIDSNTFCILKPSTPL